MTFININFRLCLGLLPSPIVDLPGPSLFGTLCKKVGTLLRYCCLLITVVSINANKTAVCLLEKHVIAWTVLNITRKQLEKAFQKKRTLHFISKITAHCGGKGAIFFLAHSPFLFLAHPNTSFFPLWKRDFITFCPSAPPPPLSCPSAYVPRLPRLFPFLGGLFPRGALLTHFCTGFLPPVVAARNYALHRI
jgi:hypothetical protein